MANIAAQKGCQVLVTIDNYSKRHLSYVKFRLKALSLHGKLRAFCLVAVHKATLTKSGALRAAIAQHAAHSAALQAAKSPSSLDKSRRMPMLTAVRLDAAGVSRPSSRGCLRWLRLKLLKRSEHVVLDAWLDSPTCSKLYAKLTGPLLISL